jgi:hypothetical protein
MTLDHLKFIDFFLDVFAFVGRAYFLILLLKKVYRMFPFADCKFMRVQFEQDTENQAFSIVFVLVPGKIAY